MRKTATESKPPKAKRRANSAIAGGIFLSRRDVGLRWGLGIRTVIAKEKAGLLIPIKLGNDQVVRYALRDVEMIEAQARAK